jgi:hypothetical protein
MSPCGRLLRHESRPRRELPNPETNLGKRSRRGRNALTALTVPRDPNRPQSRNGMSQRAPVA